MSDERHPDPELEPVATLPYEEAWLLAGRLKAEGIDAHVWPETPEAAYARALSPGADVYVHRDSLEAARKIVKEIQD